MTKQHDTGEDSGLTLAALSGIVGGLLTAQYRSDLRESIRRLRQNSQIAQTAVGRIEYAEAGNGLVVLVSHGTLGGYDEGLIITRPLIPHYRVISPSRAGYLRTPLRVGLSPSLQGDAHAALLDTLGIERAAVLAISGGGPSAIQFAVRHPDRCSALVMLCAVSQRFILTPVESTAVIRLLYQSRHSDTMSWLLINALISVMPLVAPIPYAQRLLMGDSEKVSTAVDLLRAYFPMSQRKVGAQHDFEQMALLPDFVPEQITAPTLSLHGVYDSLVPFSQAESLTRRINGAELVALQDGADHALFVTHREEVWPRILAFLGRVIGGGLPL